MPVIPVQGRAHSPPLPPWERLPLPKFADSREYKGKSGYPRAAALRCHPALFRAGGEKRGKKTENGEEKRREGLERRKEGKKNELERKRGRNWAGMWKMGMPGGSPPPRAPLPGRAREGKNLPR